MKQDRYVYIDTYGCSANQNNSEIMAGLLSSSGYHITNNKDIADTIVINSCVVKSKTENKIKRKIQDLSDSGKLVVVTGCMPDSDDSIDKLNPKALQLSTSNVKNIVSLMEKRKSLPVIQGYREEKIFLPKVPLNKLISITQISEGCLSSCSFCKTKLAKGGLFSYSQERIVKSIKQDLENGAKEVWLTSQGNACYGMDRGKRELPELLDKIVNLPGRFKIRIGMMNPQHVLPILSEMIEIYKNPKMYKFLHVPIQSASNSVLRSMKRTYKIEHVEKIINEFRKEFPDITIATDIITGYPTEDEGDHVANLEFIGKYRPDVLNLSKFSKHKNTVADKLRELPIEIANKRNIDLMRLHKQTAGDNKLKFKGRKAKIFVNKKEGFYEGRDESYNIVLIYSDDGLLGKNVSVVIKDTGVHHMVGEVLNG
ncbi:hypothetical protein CMI42_03465 [Candidatus Pacearchaeota archaeon]|nr:hypothetical protein [Candidatus Pacearchaeota archaeon]